MIIDEGERVQQWACAALGAMTRGNAQERTRAGNAGAVEAVVAAMTAHRQSEQVQRWACDALGHMTVCNVENQIRVGDAGGMDAVVSGMNVHSQSGQVQVMACAALCAALGALVQDKNAENRTLAIRAEAVAAVERAVTTHSANAQVQRFATPLMASFD